jgi:hypothetical protein
MLFGTTRPPYMTTKILAWTIRNRRGNLTSCLSHPASRYFDNHITNAKAYLIPRWERKRQLWLIEILGGLRRERDLHLHHSEWWENPVLIQGATLRNRGY